MNKADRGAKHICPECATKYYDLKKKIILCPRCGSPPAVPQARRRRDGRRTTSAAS